MRVATVAFARPAAPVGLRALWSAPQVYRGGQALALGGLAASVVSAARCDDDNDDDDEPLTLEQQAHADQIESLKKGAKLVSITPAMAICLVGGLAVPLAGFIAQGATLPTTFASMACSVGVLYSVVAASVQTKPKQVQDLMADARDGKFPTLLFAIYSAGIASAAATTCLRAGPTASLGATTAVSVVATGIIYAGVVAPMRNLAEQKAA
jgi:hypothetical protein|eukprot:COSAG02_NODE_6998_length_3236_cov_1.563277_3_plen_210_part_00